MFCLVCWFCFVFPGRKHSLSTGRAGFILWCTALNTLKPIALSNTKINHHNLWKIVPVSLFALGRYHVIVIIQLWGERRFGVKVILDDIQEYYERTPKVFLLHLHPFEVCNYLKTLPWESPQNHWSPSPFCSTAELLEIQRCGWKRRPCWKRRPGISIWEASVIWEQISHSNTKSFRKFLTSVVDPMCYLTACETFPFLCSVRQWRIPSSLPVINQCVGGAGFN